MVKNSIKLTSLLIYSSSFVGIYASSESHKGILLSNLDLTIHEHSISEKSSRGCLASSESYFAMSSETNTQSLIYDRKNHYKLHCTRANHFHPNLKVNAAILDNNKVVTAQLYRKGLWVDTLDNNAPAQHTALHSLPDIKDDAYIEHLKSLPNHPTALLASIFAGRYIVADLQTQRATPILPDTYIAQAIPDSTGNGIWYRSVEESGIVLNNGANHYNHRVGHYDMRSGKTTQLVLLPDAIKEISLNKSADRCLLNMHNGTHYIYDMGTSRRALININRHNVDSKHAFFFNDGRIVYFKAHSINDKLTLSTYELGYEPHGSIGLSCFGDHTPPGDETAYLENSQLLVAYNNDSSIKIYECSAE